ncbi:hypothetical protein ACJA88_004143 [Fusarium oxysporum]
MKDSLTNQRSQTNLTIDSEQGHALSIVPAPLFARESIGDLIYGLLTLTKFPEPECSFRSIMYIMLTIGEWRTHQPSRQTNGIKPFTCTAWIYRVGMFMSTTDMSILNADRTLGDGLPHSLPHPADILSH